MKAMTRSDLVIELASLFKDLTHADAESAVDALVEAMRQALSLIHI